MTSSPRAIPSQQHPYWHPGIRDPPPSICQPRVAGADDAPAADPALTLGAPSSALVSTPLFSLPASAAAPNPFLLPGTSLCSMSQLPPCPSATPLFSSPRLEPPPWKRGIRNAGTTSNHNVPSPPSHTCVVRLDRSRFRAPRRALYLVQHRRPGSTLPASLDVRLTEARWVMPKAASQRRHPQLPSASLVAETRWGAPQSPSKNKAARPPRSSRQLPNS